MTGSPRRVACAGAAAAAALFTGSCTDAGDRGGDGPTTAASSPIAPPTSAIPTPSHPSSASPTPSATGPTDPAQAEKKVRDAWQRFASPKTSVKDKVAAVENGEQYALMIEAWSKDPKARALRVRIDKVTFTSDLDATVRYTLLSHGRKVGPGGPGASVLQNGTWKVSFKTVCSLTRYGKDVPQAAVC